MGFRGFAFPRVASALRLRACAATRRPQLASAVPLALHHAVGPSSSARWRSLCTSSHTGGQHLELSDAAVARLQTIQKSSTEPLYLRVAIDSGGCSGFQYSFDLVHEQPGEEDRVFERDGARVVVDSTSLRLLAGSVIHFHEEMIGASFVISDNPNSDGSCGCGVSFSPNVEALLRDEPAS